MGQNHQENDAKTSIEPHVLIFPIPLQGPVSYALKLAELLCLSNIHVTFLNTDHIHGPLLRHSQVLSRFSHYPNFQFETIPDGLKHENPVSVDKFEEMMKAVNAAGKPLFREMMVSGKLSRSSKRPVTVMILDACFDFAVEVCAETSIPVFCFQTASPCCLWTSSFNLSNLIKAGVVPFKGNDSEELVKDVPGTQGFLRRRDLASFCRSDDLSNMELQRVMREALIITQAQGLILNTFEELDGLVLPHIQKLCSNVYTIGPIHSLHKAQLMDDTTPSPETTFSNSTWKEDRTCLSWLDKHPPKSVVYVSIGSLVTMTSEQLLEIWHGLVNSGKPFLWVRRPGSIIGGIDEFHVPSELLDRTKKMGFIIDWAPQEDVLAHRAIGAFFTHSGWNSTMESLVEGVPMICWPHSYDQQVNSRFAGEVWKVGIDIKDTQARLIVEEAVRDVMSMKRDLYTQSASAWKILAKESISETGSSSKSFARLVDDIRALSSSMKHSSIGASYVDCNNEGAEFVEATVDTTLSSFLQDSQHEDLDQFFPCSHLWSKSTRREKSEKVIPLAVQVSHFESGGVLIPNLNLEKLRNLEEHYIYEGRVVFDNFTDLRYVRYLFHFVEFECLLEINEQVCPRFILEFYSQYHLSYSDTGQMLVKFVIQNHYFSLCLEDFAQILRIPCEGACVFSDRWSLDELVYGTPSEGPYQTNLPSPDDIISYVREDREGQVTRIHYQEEIEVQNYQILTREIVSTLKHLEEIIRENVFCLGDRGTRRGRQSTSSSSAFDQPSSSHLNDDDDDGNDEGTSRSSSPSPIRYVNSLTNQVPQVFQNPPNIDSNLEPFYTRQTEIINRQVQLRDEHRGGVRSIGKSLRKLWRNMRK
ncbi:7-deoxyloganetic acid glucosyltransferase-like protein [Tanacetum coccineum]